MQWRTRWGRAWFGVWALTGASGMACATGVQEESGNPLFGDGGQAGSAGPGDDGDSADEGDPAEGPCEGDETQECYGGPQGTAGVGACTAGVRTCVDGVWSACEDEIAPADEVCDGIDNDCDGETDEEIAGLGEACSTTGGCGGETACVDGAEQCLGTGGGSAEVCDGMDNDCDGAVDNGNPGGGADCSTGQMGVCGAGAQQCTNGQLQCQPKTPAGAEVCGNLADDDCDGQVDDDCGGGSSCTHDICQTGVALQVGCDPCVDQICGQDAFCCQTEWDDQCVMEVQSICGQTC